MQSELEHVMNNVLWDCDGNHLDSDPDLSSSTAEEGDLVEHVKWVMGCWQMLRLDSIIFDILSHY